MLAIITKYLGATNHRGSRIMATDGEKRVFSNYDNSKNNEDNHIDALLKLCHKLNVSGQMHVGHLPGGRMVFVWDGDVIGVSRTTETVGIEKTVAT